MTTPFTLDKVLTENEIADIVKTYDDTQTQVQPEQRITLETSKPKEVTPEDISSEDKQSWIRYVFGAEDFRKTYRLYDNKLVIVFGMLSPVMRDKIQRLLPRNIQGESGTYKAHIFRVRATCSAISITGDNVNYVSNATNTDPEDINAIIMSTLTPGMLTTLYSCYADYERLVNRLIERASTSDFWKATVWPI